MRTKVNSKTLGLFAFVFIIIFLIPGLISVVSAKGSEQVMNNLNISAQLHEDGSMRVTEVWTINLKERDNVYRNLYKTFPYNSAQQIEDIAVQDLDNGTAYRRVSVDDPEDVWSAESGTCYIYDGGDYTEIGWYFPRIESGIRRFNISYTVTNSIVSQGGIATLYHPFVGNDGGFPIKELTGEILLPAGAQKGDLRAWLHCDVASTLEIASGEKLTFTAKDVPAKTMVEVRMCAPAAVFPNVKVKDGENPLPAIEAQESTWAAESLSRQKWQFALGIIDVAGGALLLILGVAALIFHRRKHRRHQLLNPPIYTREVPQGNSPGGISPLFYFYSGGVENNNDRKGRVYSATIMSLVRKGHLAFSQEEKEFRIVLQARENPLPLSPGESVFLDLMSWAAESHGGGFTMSEFEDFAEREYTHTDLLLEEFWRRSKAELTPRGCYEPKSGNGVLTIFGMLGVVSGLIILFASTANLLYLPIGCIIFGVLMFFAANPPQRLSPQGEAALADWVGLKKYMLDFSRMTEYGVPQLPLWEEFLVYATMMNISKEVCEQLKAAYPELNNEETFRASYGDSMLRYMLWSPYYHSSYIGGGDFSDSLSHMMSNAGASATRLAHPPTSSGGGGFGGGGFSGGGGGGFGGGGGSGAR